MANTHAHFIDFEALQKYSLRSAANCYADKEIHECNDCSADVETHVAHVGFRYIVPSGEEFSVSVGDEYTVRNHHVIDHRPS